MITLAPIPAPTVSQFMSHPQTPTQPITQPPPHQTSRHPKAYATVRLLLILKGWVWSPLALWLSHSLFPPKQSYFPHSLSYSFSKQPPPTDDSPLVTYPKFQLFKSHHSFLLQPPPLDCNWLLFLMVQIDCRTLRTRFYVKRAAIIERALCPKLNGSKIILVGVEMYFYYFIF